MTTLPRRLDPELLVAQTEWMRALVRELVRPDRVDDVVQETFLAALERPPRARDRGGWSATGLRSWLRVVARNAALVASRGESRRRAREEEVAHSAQVEATDAIVERASVHGRVVQALLALDEPARSTLLMRYFEGLSSAQIARRLGVPAATVRQRLSRGLGRLRRELGVEDSPGMLSVLLVPTGTREGGAALAGAAWKLAALAAGLAAVAWWLSPLWSAPGKTTALQLPTQVLASKQRDGAVPATASIANPGDRLARESVVAADTSIVVVDARDRRALAGVVVAHAVAQERGALAATLERQWREAGIGELAPRWLALAEEQAVPPIPTGTDEPPFAPGREFSLGRTDAAGRLVFADEMPPGSALILRCPGYAPRYVPGSMLHAVAQGDAGERELEIGLQPAARLDVQVLDETGAALPEAWLRVERTYPPEGVRLPDLSLPLVDQIAWHGPTDEAGRCSIVDLPTGWLLYVTALGELRSEAREVVLAPGAESQELILLAERPGSLSGTVLDADESPVAGVAVTHHINRWTGRFGGSARTNEDGRFLIADVAAGRGILTVADGRSPMRSRSLDVDVVAGGRIDVGPIVLPTLLPLSGRIVSDATDDFEGYYWNVLRRDGASLRGYMPFRADGSFSISITPGHAVLRVLYKKGEWGEPYGIAAVPVELPCEGLEIRVPAITGVLRGRLPDELESTEELDMRLFPRTEEASWEPHGEGATGLYGTPVTGGVFEGVLLPGRYAVEVQLDEETRSWVPSVVIEVGAVTDLGVLSLAVAHLQGTVLSESGEPVAGALVALKTKVPAGGEGRNWGEDRWVSHEARTDASGTFAIAGVGAGVWRVFASDGRGRSSLPVNLELLPGEERTLELRVRQPGRIRGRVTHAGLPVPGWPVRWSYDNRETLRAQFEINPTDPIVTDGEGRFELSPFDAGSYLIRVAHAAQHVDLGPGESVEIAIELANRRARVRMTAPEGYLDLSLLKGYQIGGAGVGRTCLGRPVGNGYFELEAPSGARLMLSGIVKGPPSLSRQGYALAVVDAERLSGDCEIPAAAGSLVLHMLGPLRHAPAPALTLLALEGVALPRMGDLPVEEDGEDRLRYRSIPPGSLLAIEGLDADGRTLRREIAYEGPEPLELDWPDVERR